MRFAAYADESYHSEGRYRSIGSFSFPSDHVPTVTAALRGILDGARVSEFKWRKVKGRGYRECAERLLDYVVENLDTLDIRVDVTIWDVGDSRHNVTNRDDRKNYDIMFFHLFRNAMCRRDRGAMWDIFPDRKCDADWPTVRECLTSVGRRREYCGNLLLAGEVSEQAFQVDTFQQIESIRTPPCQVADLFAGVAVFSRREASNFAAWRRFRSPQRSLFGPPEKPRLPSGSGARFAFLEYLDSRAKTHRLGVSLKTRGYLWTPDPGNRINFWHYEPQHELDRAPIIDG